MLNTEKFFKVKLLKLILDDSGNLHAHAAQYYSSSKFLLNNYLKKYAGILKNKTIEKFEERALSFKDKLEISEHK